MFGKHFSSLPSPVIFLLCTIISHIYFLCEADLHHSATHHPQLRRSILPHENKEMYPTSAAFL